MGEDGIVTLARGSRLAVVLVAMPGYDRASLIAPGTSGQVLLPADDLPTLAELLRMLPGRIREMGAFLRAKPVSASIN